MTKVAVIGAGLIGRSWAIVFARAGFSVNLWDPFSHQTDAAMTFIMPLGPTGGAYAELCVVPEPQAALAHVWPH